MNVCTGGVSIALTAIGKLVGDLVVFPQGETTGGWGGREGISKGLTRLRLVLTG